MLSNGKYFDHQEKKIKGWECCHSHKSLYNTELQMLCWICTLTGRITAGVSQHYISSSKYCIIYQCCACVRACACNFSNNPLYMAVQMGHFLPGNPVCSLLPDLSSFSLCGLLMIALTFAVRISAWWSFFELCHWSRWLCPCCCCQTFYPFFFFLQQLGLKPKKSFSSPIPIFFFFWPVEIQRIHFNDLMTFLYVFDCMYI